MTFSSSSYSPIFISLTHSLLVFDLTPCSFSLISHPSFPAPYPQQSASNEQVWSCVNSDQHFWWRGKSVAVRRKCQARDSLHKTAFSLCPATDDRDVPPSLASRSPKTAPAEQEARAHPQRRSAAPKSSSNARRPTHAKDVGKE